MLASIAGGVAFPILPTVGLRVGLPLPFIGLVLAANRISRLVASPAVGLMTDRFGGKRTLVVGLALQVVVMALFALGVRTSHTGAFFLAGRVLHGFGSSCVFVAAQALALHAGGREHGGRAGGAVRAAIQLGVPIGLAAGGLVADYWSESSIFEAGGAALVVAALAAAAVVPDHRVAPARDASVASAAMTFVDRRLAAVGLLAFAAAFAGSGTVLTTTTLLVHARHLAIATLPERTTASLLMGVLVTTEALAMPPLGRLGDARRAHATIAASGLALTIPGLVVIAYAARPDTLAIGLGVLGLALAGLGPSLLALVGRLVAPERRGLGVGALQVAADGGGALGPIVGSALLAGSLSMPYLVTAAVSALLLPVAVWLVRAADQSSVQR